MIALVGHSFMPFHGAQRLLFGDELMFHTVQSLKDGSLAICLWLIRPIQAHIVHRLYAQGVSLCIQTTPKSSFWGGTFVDAPESI